MGGKAKYLLRGRKRPPTFPWCQTVGGPFRALSGARKCLPTRPGHESGARDGRGRPAILTFPTKVPSDSLGWIGSLKRTSDKSLFPMALGSCGHRITHQLRPINMNGRSILAVTSSLIFQGVEGLILDLPAGSSPPHDVPDVFRNQEKVGDPTEMLHLPIGVDLPVFQHIDQLVGVRLVERHAITEPKMMHNARRWILQGKDLHLAGLVEGPQVVEQKRVVARLDANDVMRASLTQIAKVGGVGAEGVFDDDDR